jgi:two-component system response regulator YcbB
MKFYIVDDVRSIIKVLENIIEDKKLGEVIGFSVDAVTATAEIIAMKPDVVLVDLLMPVKDGVSIVREVKQICPDISFIMISQVSNKEMVSDAYNAGVEFFISKPINIIEVENVVKRVTKKIEMEKTLGGAEKYSGRRCCRGRR